MNKNVFLSLVALLKLFEYLVLRLCKRRRENTYESSCLFAISNKKNKFFPSDLELLPLLFINININIRAFEHVVPSCLVATVVWTFFRTMPME